jgi:hypothetical protein
VVARWTGDLDVAQMQSQLNSQDLEATGEPEILLNAKTAHMPVQEAQRP